jgi:SAM-dependent methyltransferase
MASCFRTLLLNIFDGDDIEMQSLYDREFYDYHKDEARRSAEIVVPLVLNRLNSKTVVDVGCGNGTWLKVFQENGVADILGIDGSYVSPEILVISPDKFISQNLEESLDIKQKFDLVVSLEVAEHLSNESAERFVDSLTRLGSVVLFSAAIPYQGGINHINEQWQSYWTQLFQQKGYLVSDWIRKEIWNNENIAYYYRQNILIFADSDSIKNQLKHEQAAWGSEDITCLSVVHPGLYLDTSKELVYLRQEVEKFKNLEHLSLGKAFKMLPLLFYKSLRIRGNLFKKFILSKFKDRGKK